LHYSAAAKKAVFVWRKGILPPRQEKLVLKYKE